MSDGLDRVRAVLGGGVPDRVPIVPILHTMGARLIGVSIGAYATDAALMARAVLAPHQRFGYDGVQLSLGVATEAEALGAPVVQPPDGLPVVVGPLLEAPEDLARLRVPDPARDGRLPLFAEAVSRAAGAVGGVAWVVATIRGPLLMATQLRGVERTLLDLIDRPGWCTELLQFTTEVAIACGRYLAGTGCHAVAIGEATCSPDFISPAMYRAFVRAHHERLVAALHDAGIETTVMHICGRSLPVVGDIASTGCDVMDIDAQVDPVAALDAAGERMVLRGNVDPAALLRYGEPAEVHSAVDVLMARMAGRGRFILGSGCDVPPDTPPRNVDALVRAGRRASASAR